MTLSIPIVKKQLESILSKMAVEQCSDTEFYRPIGTFIDLCACSSSNSPALKKALSFAADDFRAILYGLQIFEELIGQNPVDDPTLRSMTARAIIQQFFLDVRSIFDYMLLCSIILFENEIRKTNNKELNSFNEQFDKQKTIPNFARFRSKIFKTPEAAKTCFVPDLYELWSNCEWFDGFNNLRNGITHEGMFIGVRNDNPDLFLIETLDGRFPIEEQGLPDQMFDREHAISFRIFSGLYSGMLMFVLQNWSTHLINKMQLHGSSKAYTGRGGTALRSNIKSVIRLL